jgi:hypothetical protein
LFRFLRLLVALLVLVGLIPGGAEVLENLEHLAHDGHFAHDEAHADAQGEALLEEEGHGDENDEHGCTPMMHVCGCHTSLSALTGLDALTIRAPTYDEAPAPLLRDGRPLARAIAPPTPPPNA